MGLLRNGVFMLLAIAVGIAMLALFIVGERDLALKFRFGEIVREEYVPGLHVKFPAPINTVLKLEKRIMTINNPTEEFLTAEKKNLFVDFFVKWRIREPAQFYRSTAGQEAVAAQRLLEIIKDGIRAQFAKRTVVEVVSAERSELMDEMLVRAGETARELGIEIVDVRVKRIDLPDDVSDSVFNRMRQERARVASQLRAEGEEQSERIRAEADRERTVILAEAYREAQQIRGEGDAAAADIYAQAYSKNPEFYAFHRSMQAYRESIGSDQDVLVLKPDSDFFKYLNESGVDIPRQR